MSKKSKIRTCRVCGCTDDNCYQCIEKTGGPCYWVEADLCSTCVILPEPAEPIDYFEDLCPRCQCCSTDWEECWSCGGEGRRGYEDDLQFEDPLWYSPGDWIHCDICDGKGGWTICLGGCDENGKHQSEIVNTKSEIE